MEATIIEISMRAIAHNVRAIQSYIGKKTLFAPCVKGNAYGHGIVGVAKLLTQLGADKLCVTSIEEAMILRKNGIKLPIVIMGFVPRERLRDIITSRASVFVYEMNTAKALSRLAPRAKRIVPVHIKIDTGMSRQGVGAHGALDFIYKVMQLKGLRVEGIATHFATSDEPENPNHFRAQLKTFLGLRKEILSSWKEKIKPISHCANSAATLLAPVAHLDMVRPGLSVYGYYPSDTTREDIEKRGMHLQPSLSFKTKVAAVKNLPAGACVSYGCTCTTSRPTTIAVLPVGYYDGIDRGLSNKGSVLIRGTRAAILGRVCMDITVVDITGIRGVQQEDEVVIIGRQGRDEISAEEIGRHIGTINYEVTTRLPAHILRKYQ